MTQLACSGCGRGVATVAPLVQLAASERLCPRCGAQLREERRVSERRSHVQRRVEIASAPRRERRLSERRLVQRRAVADPFNYNPLVDGRIRWQTAQRLYDDDR